MFLRTVLIFNSWASEIHPQKMLSGILLFFCFKDVLETLFLVPIPVLLILILHF